MIRTVTDVVSAARELASRLQQMNPFDATCSAVEVALSHDAYVRHALAAALVARFPLVGDDFIIDVLRRDSDFGVRSAAGRAALARDLQALHGTRPCGDATL